MKTIVVLTSPRTGSNLLVDSLGRHPQAISAGEWFNNECEPFVVENKKLGVDGCNLVKFCGIQAYVPVVKRLIRSPAALKVYLFREDVDAQIESLRKACRTGKFVEELPGPPKPFPDDPMKPIRLAEQHFREPADFVVSFEQMVSNWDAVIRQILLAAGWDDVPVSQARTKIT
jgi:LPS sulfotransferase NodH